MRRRAWFAAASALLARSAWGEAMPDPGVAVERLAAELADGPHQPPDDALPPALAALDYDGYRRLSFTGPPARLGAFRAMPFHRGYLFPHRVALHLADQPGFRAWAYAPADFAHAPAEAGDLGFAGVRLLSELHAPGRFDEVVSFLGASYFRALGRGHAYGVSARGLAVGLGGVEEFPLFCAFWLAAEGERAVVHALLDGPSLAAAFRLDVTPGDATIVEVRATVFARREAMPGLAPASSMYWYGEGEVPTSGPRRGAWRPAVHDSDALLLETAGGERLLRPLDNPATGPRITDFAAASPRGFGLLQRRRGFDAFRDAEARYHARPSLWTEPLGDWGEGVLRLLELPARDEYHDNIALAWLPARGPRPGAPWRVGWRLHWADDAPRAPGLARLAGLRREGEALVLRFDGGEDLERARAETVGATALDLAVEPGGRAATLRLRPLAKAPHATLRRDGRAASETWLGPVA